jgi:xanthine dehydrogenase accessory factor
MQEHARMMAAWQSAQGVCVLVTVVGTRGSSYRSPGARMLILPDGSRIGAVSGGCLEGELCRRAHWWTSQSPAVLKTFDTSTQEDNEGFGLGCGGGIDLFVERLPAADVAGETNPLLAQQRVNQSREPSALAVLVHATEGCALPVGERFALESAHDHPEIATLLRRGVKLGYSFTQELREGPFSGCRFFVESLTLPVQLLVCGAGTDAQPLVAQAAALGWSITVMDRRADFARPGRFPEAERVIAANDATAFAPLRFDQRTAAIIMSHSFAQDTFFLETLLDTLLAQRLGYLGVLGSRRRTLDVLARLGRDAIPACLHAPAGLDIGAETPEQIALSILSEMQATFTNRPGRPLRQRDGSIHGREHRLEYGPDQHDNAEQHSTPLRDCGLL